MWRYCTDTACEQCAQMRAEYGIRVERDSLGFTQYGDDDTPPPRRAAPERAPA